MMYMRLVIPVHITMLCCCCCCHRKLYYFVQSKSFEVGLMVVIIANSALMATVHYNEPHAMVAAVEALNYAFTCIYVLEFLIKVRQLDISAPILRCSYAG
jgi:hypothetical protein